MPGKSLAWICSLLLLLHAVGAIADEEQAPASDTCILTLSAPAEASVSIDGRQYGERRVLTFRGLEPGRIYQSQLEVWLNTGEVERRRLLIQGGQRLQTLFDRPAGRPELVVQHGHMITDMVWSSDARRIVSAGAGPAMLWDVRRGLKLREYGTNVSLARIDPSGGRLLTAGSNSAELWETESGRSLRRFTGTGKNDDIVSIDFGAEGRTVVIGFSGYYDREGRASERPLTVAPEGEIRYRAYFQLFDVESGRRIAEWEGRPARTNSSITHEGVWSFSPDSKIELRDSANGRKLREFAHEAEFEPMRVGGDGFVYGWWTEPRPGVPEEEAGLPTARRLVANLPVVAGRGKFGQSFADSAGGEWSVLPSGGALRFDVVDSRTERKYRAFDPEFCIHAAAFSRDNRLLAAGSCDEKISVWDLEADRRILQLGSGAHRAEIVPGGKFALAHTRFGTSLFDIENGEFLGRRDGFQVQLDSSGRRGLFTVLTPPQNAPEPAADDVGETILRDLETDRELLRVRAHFTLFAPGGQCLLTSDDRQIDDEGNFNCTLYRGDDGRLVRRFQLPGLLSNETCCFTPDGTRLLFMQVDTGDLLTYDARSGELLRRFNIPDGWSIFGGDRFALIARSSVYGEPPKPPEVWNLETRHRVCTLEDGFPIQGSLQAAFSRDETRLVLLDWQSGVAVFDARDGRLLRHWPELLDVSSAQFAADDQTILAGGLGGRILYLDPRDGSRLAEVAFPNDGREWLAVSPQGLFEGSAGGRRQVTFRIGGGLDVEPVDRFFQDFYRPGLMDSLLRGERPLPEIEIGRALPPVLRILSPKPGEVDTGEVRLEVEVSDQGGGIGNVALFQNGARMLARGTANQTGDTVNRTFEVALVDGSNHFRITAASADGSWEAEPAELTLTYNRPIDKPAKLHLVSIGVSEYADTNLQLQFAAKDAQALTELFRQRAKSLYAEVSAAELVDSAATKEAICAALKTAAEQTDLEDTLVVFFAGHGAMVGQRYYFLPHELTKRADRLEDDIRAQGMPADEISDYLGRAKALKRVLIFDTCASGGAVALTGGERSSFALRGAIERLSRSQGVFTLAASSSAETAQEAKPLGHGVLSYTLLAGLGGVNEGPLAGQRIRPTNPDQVVDVLEWFSYAAGHVPRLSERYFGVGQSVQTSTQGSSFPVLPLE